MNRIEAEELRKFLDLLEYDVVYIQKIRNSKDPVYVITYNSGNPNSISSETVKRVKSAVPTQYDKKTHKFAPARLGRPILLEGYGFQLPLGAIYFKRDIRADEILRNRSR